MPPDTKIPNNFEIDKALKEFEIQASAQQTPQAGQIPKASDSDLPKMVRLVIKCSGGVIKEQKQAEYVLLGLVVLMFALSFYFFFGGKPAKQKLAPAQLEQMRLPSVNKQNIN